MDWMKTVVYHSVIITNLFKDIYHIPNHLIHFIRDGDRYHGYRFFWFTIRYSKICHTGTNLCKRKVESIDRTLEWQYLYCKLYWSHSLHFISILCILHPFHCLLQYIKKIHNLFVLFILITESAYYDEFPIRTTICLMWRQTNIDNSTWSSDQSFDSSNNTYAHMQQK